MGRVLLSTLLTIGVFLWLPAGWDIVAAADRITQITIDAEYDLFPAWSPDGLVTAKEIVREWDLDADLVTLSACETGLGRKVSGEGHIGFAHALFQAGARSLLVSLWKVEDRATAMFMRRFYENLFGEYDGERAGHTGESMSKAEALREAKFWLRDYVDDSGHRPYEHPYYWSAFVLIGDR